MTVESEPSNESDEDLVARAQAGSRGAFDTLIRRHQKPLYFLCLRYVHDHDAAADLAQRAFIRVLEKLDGLREVQTFKSWLYRIAVNLSLNHLRDHARFVDDDASPPEPDDGVETSAGIETHERAQALRRAVVGLPTKQRMTLELRIYEDLSFREIALALDTTEGAAKVNFHYAVRKLRALLGRIQGHKVGGRP